MPHHHSTESPKGLLLVVDDERFITEYMSLILREDGYDVLTASDAEEGWELFQRERSRVRAVLTDLVVPGAWDGLELARRVRLDAPGTPVLLVTGYRPPGPLGPGCAVLPKPFTAEALCYAVRHLAQPSPRLVTSDAGTP